MQYESERIEYKSQMIDDIYKEVIAFANTDGGVIYLGIDDKGNLIGIENVDETYTRLTNGIRDAIAPDVTMFVRYVLQDNKVIRIEVAEGSYKFTMPASNVTVTMSLKKTTSSAKNPSSGDTSNIYLWAGVLGVSATALVALVAIWFWKRRK